MKRKYLVIAILLMLMGSINVKALVYSNCEVLASFKLQSSLDEEQIICKGEEFGNGTDSIYYSGKGNVIVLNNANIYYLESGKVANVTLDIANDNNISLLNLNNKQIKVTGKGSLKFKQNSYVKKVVNGLPIYNYSFNDKLILSDDNKIYEGTTLEFEESYDTLKELNSLNEQYNIDDFVLTQVVDYNKMTSVTVTESWISSHIMTDLDISLDNGYGVIKYVEPKIEEKVVKSDSSTLESDNVILISEDKVNSKYKLEVDDLKEDEIADKVSNSIDKLLVGLYDVNVYNGKKIVSMKNGSYTIKIKLEDNINEYDDYQIIYVNDDGEIEEYIDAKIDGGYIVFETSHLSQYGVIAIPKEEVPIETVSVEKRIVNVGNVLKVSLLVSFIAVALGLIGFTLFKSNLLNKKKRKRKKAL